MRWLPLALALACSSSSATRVAVKADTTVAATATVETKIQEERGASTTVVEEFGPAAEKEPDGVPVGAVSLPAVGPVALLAAGSPRRLLRRTTIRQDPIGPAGPAVRIGTDVAAKSERREETKLDASAETTKTVRPAAGCVFGAGLLVPVIIALVALIGGPALVVLIRKMVHP